MVAVVAAVVVLTLAALFIFHVNQPASQGAAPLQGSSQAQTSAAPSQQVSKTGSNATLFSSAPYAQYSYLISGPNLSQQAQSALAGFKFTRTPMQNGSIEINISLSGSSQGNSVVLAPGYRMYIVEATFGDDGYGFDSSLGDDGFVIVNSTGYVV